ncbi:MAG: ABC transporter permease, partial [Gemmatimonadetes bacterium]|nr:ABC transporter permease [Gemmatimonadota bacterium]
MLAFACGAPMHALWLQKEQWRPGMVSTDVRFGWRQLRRRPGLAIAGVLTLAIGIAATTAIFSVVYGVLLKPLPYREPSRLVQLWEVNPLFKWTEANVAPGNLVSWIERNHSFESLAWYFGSDTRAGGTTTLSYGGAGEPVRVTAQQVSRNFFEVLGATPALGRTFAPGEDVAGKQRVAVLSYGFWKRQLGGDRSVVNRMIQLNGRDFLVAGVMPASFSFDNTAPDCWLPIVLNFAEVRDVRRPHYLHVVARLKNGVSI